MTAWILLALVAFLALTGTFAQVARKGLWKQRNPGADVLQALGSGLVVVGIVLGRVRFIGYTLILTGIVLALASLVARRARRP